MRDFTMYATQDNAVASDNNGYSWDEVMMDVELPDDPEMTPEERRETLAALGIVDEAHLDELMLQNLKSRVNKLADKVASKFKVDFFWFNLEYVRMYRQDLCNPKHTAAQTKEIKECMQYICRCMEVARQTWERINNN